MSTWSMADPAVLRMSRLVGASFNPMVTVSFALAPVVSFLRPANAAMHPATTATTAITATMATIHHVARRCPAAFLARLSSCASMLAAALSLVAAVSCVFRSSLSVAPASPCAPWFSVMIPLHLYCDTAAGRPCGSSATGHCNVRSDLTRAHARLVRRKTRSPPRESPIRSVSDGTFAGRMPRWRSIMGGGIRS